MEPKSEILIMRIPPSIKARLVQAAKNHNLSVTDFVLDRLEPALLSQKEIEEIRQKKLQISFEKNAKQEKDVQMLLDLMKKASSGGAYGYRTIGREFISQQPMYVKHARDILKAGELNAFLRSDFRHLFELIPGRRYPNFRSGILYELINIAKKENHQ